MAQVTPVDVNNEYKMFNIKPEDIQQLREWMKTQPHLPNEYVSDLDFVLAYHSCEYNIARTKEVLDLNFTLRTLFAFYQNREIDKSLERAFESWLVTPLTTPTNKGYRPIYCQLLDPDASKFVYGDVVRAFVMIIDLYLYEEGAVPGVAIILNMDKVSLDHISRIDLVVAQQFFYFLQEAMFVRLKEFHFINAPSFIDRLLSMFKPFMKNDFLRMLHVHVAGSGSLNEFMPVTALPKDAGGENLHSFALRGGRKTLDAGRFQPAFLEIYGGGLCPAVDFDDDDEKFIAKDNDQMWNKLKANEKIFKEETKKRVAESKRPGVRKTMSTFFPGLEGSFKKLHID